MPRKTLNVLAYLILRCQRHASRDSIASALFPDDDFEKARGHLRRNLSYLLSSLPPTPNVPSFVLADFERIAWNSAAPAEIDVYAFERACKEGRSDDALAQYSGELLPTLYDEWVTGDCERLRDAFHEALTHSIIRDRSLRRFEQAIETARRLLMSIRYEAGDRAGALSTFELFATAVRREMQADPMPETVAVRDAILRGARLATSEPSAQKPDALVDTPILPFVGRAPAMDSAIEAWHNAADGRAKVVFISGPAGIGKSRFVAEYARAIEREGGITVLGETAAGGERRPYESFVDALQSAQPMRVRNDSRAGNDLWRRLLDELLDSHAEATFMDDRSARIRLFDAIRRGFAELARSRPVAIILEDLHWAGTASIDLFEFVATKLGASQILLIATFRSDELSLASPLQALRRQLSGRGIATTIELEALSIDDATSAFRGAAPSTVRDDLVAQAVARAAGHPLILTEALRDVLSGREMSSGSAESAFSARLETVSDTAKTVLVYGAIFGARFDIVSLAAATGWSDAEIVTALSEPINLGLIRASSRPPGLAFAFTHHLAHHVVLESLSERDRTMAHALAANVLIGLHGNGRGDEAVIARHLIAAGERARAAEYYVNAARQALNAFANVEARDLATDGIDALAQIGSSHHAMHYDLYVCREIAYARIGQSEKRRADAQMLFALAQGDPHRECDALERRFDAARNDADERREILTLLEPLAAFSDRNKAMVARANAEHAFLEGDYERCRDAAITAASHFDDLGDGRLALAVRSQYVTALYRLGNAEQVKNEIAKLRVQYDACDDLELRMMFHRLASAVQTGDAPELGLEDARIALDLATRMGDLLAQARARQNMGVYLGRARRHKEALQEHEASLALYRDVGDAFLSADATPNVATVRGFCGDHRGAEQLLEQFPVDSARFPLIAVLTGLNRAAFAMRSKRFDDALRHAFEADEIARMRSMRLLMAKSDALIGEILARSGQSERACMYFEKAITAVPTLSQPRFELQTRAAFARVLAEMGNVKEASMQLEQARAMSEQYPMEHFAEVAWTIAAAYALLGDASQATAFAEQATAAFADEALCMDPDLADAYALLPWHRHVFAYLQGRSVPLGFVDSM